MLTRSTRIQLVTFAVIAVLVIGYTGFHYANLGQLSACAGTTRCRWTSPTPAGSFPRPT